MTSSAGSRPTTVIRATPIRFATALISGTLACNASVPALHGQAPSNQTIQPAPQKPSAAIPATPPTSISPHQSAETVTQPLPQRVDVEFLNGKISVDSSNGSLNQVLHEIATKAGIKVTGSVNEERVFGHYGPAAPSVVLAMLLDGTGANMLLVDDPKGASELILTPRRGSPTPPNPNAAQEANSEESEGPSRYIPPIRPYQPPSPGGRGPLAQGPGPQPTQPADAGQSSNDPNSARQIYDQLQRNAQQGGVQQQPPQQ